MAFSYGINKEIKDREGKVVQIKSYPKDFNGTIDITRIKIKPV